MKRFKDKTIIITGADSNIGHATALRFAQEGANVTLIGKTQDSLQKIAEQFPQDHTWIHTDNHLSIACDTDNQTQITEMVRHTLKKFGHIDILVNNVGYALKNHLHDGEAIDTSINNTALICQATLPALAETQGNIINISALFDISNDCKISDYQNATKIISEMTQNLACQQAPKNIRVNAVSSMVCTDKDCANISLPQYPLGRTATPQDIAAVIAFLASEDAAMVTGVTIPVDGGIHTLST